jgi:hypothetical protein
MLTETQVRIEQGTVGQLGQCRVGLKAVAGERATVSIVTPQSAENKCFVSLDVRQGDVVPVCGGFHRVVAVEAGISLVLQPGPLDSAPPLDLITLTPGAIARLVLPSGPAMAPFASVELLAVVTSGEGRPVARFATWAGDGDKVGSVTIELGVGDHLQVEGRRCPLLAIGAASDGLPAFVALSIAP